VDESSRVAATGSGKVAALGMLVERETNFVDPEKGLG
jgi:hypothetical protein